MRTALLTDDGFTLVERPTPEPGPHEILVRSTACGVCEGDVFQYRSVCASGAAEPIQLGHEGSGVVEAIGAEVTDLRPGDRVTSLGGPYAERWLSPAGHLVRLPDGIPEAQALGEPLACCVHAADRFGIRLGERVALLGCGFMGLSCLQLARLQGCAELVAFDPIPWRHAPAREMGADRVEDPGTRDPEAWLEALGEFDVVIEATGHPSVFPLATTLVKQHGRVVLVGYHQSEDGQRQVDVKTWNFKAIDVVNGHVRRLDEKRDAMRRAMALLAAGRLDLSRLITAYPFERIGEAFADLTARKEGLFKASLVFAPQGDGVPGPRPPARAASA